MEIKEVHVGETIVHNDTKQPPARFDVHQVLHDLHHYLPEQAALKDFIHQNTLHSFQHMKFYDGLRHASRILGFKVSLTLNEYRSFYHQKRIDHQTLEAVAIRRKGRTQAAAWIEKALNGTFDQQPLPRIGMLRANWKRHYKIDLDSMVHPILFRVLCGYLDQGISIWSFPTSNLSFLESIRELEKNSMTSFFSGKRARQLLLEDRCTLEHLLLTLVGDPALFEHYLFDQQFAHMGWSGMVSVIEQHPDTLLDKRKISLQDLIAFELLLEIDALDYHFNANWTPLCKALTTRPAPLFADVPRTELHEVLEIWQESYEWAYYDQVLRGLIEQPEPAEHASASFQAMFCIDDRECSLRRYIESIDPGAETFGTPGFFNVPFFFQPEGGKFYTKVCPAPMTPKYLIKEYQAEEGKHVTDIHFSRHSHSLYSGWLFSHIVGFWSAWKLLLNVFRPSEGAATSSSMRHMDPHSRLTIEHTSDLQFENGLQIGFTVDEMVLMVETQLKSIGLTKKFGPLIYVVGHGSSSANNTHFAAYDCGACSGRPGSVNARVFAHIANRADVREKLRHRGIVLPDETQFVGGLHDTSRDEIAFFDEEVLSDANRPRHATNKRTLLQALDLNAKERSRRFVSIDTHQPAERIHEKVKTRSVSLFEPRPELNHATNALCIVGRRSITQGLFLDRRAFMNSYDYSIDPDGKYLLGILRPAAPVCGGINLEYFFSRVDNQKLGAGTKLPHNVMGLFGVANGIDGDLRPGLPVQMIEVHDPVRLLMVVEHFPNVILDTIKKSPETYEWFANEWVHLVAINPITKNLSVFRDGAFYDYTPHGVKTPVAGDINDLIEKHEGNLPVYLLN